MRDAVKYHAITLIRLAVEKAGGKPDRDGIAQAIRDGIRFQGCNGLLNYTPSNQGDQDENPRAMVMLQVKGGKFTIVS